MNEDKPKKSADKEKYLATALERFKTCVDASTDIRETFIDDINFLNGQQWDDGALKERARDRRPALTINRLLASQNQVVNDFRQNRPAIKVRPVDSLTDPDKADVINGILRRIQNGNDARSAIDTAFYYAVGGGFGFVRIKTDYCKPDSFDQDIYIDRIENPCMVYFPLDIISQPDYSDAPYAFIRQRISKDDFESKYPDIDMSNWEKRGNGDPAWIEEDFVYIAEYFHIEEEDATLILLDDGQKYAVKEKVKAGDIMPDGAVVVMARPTSLKSVHRSLITQNDILEPESIFPSSYIPIVPFLGQEINIDGEKQYISLTRFAKDPQRMYNFWNTAFTEQVALAPKAPYIAAAGQIEEFGEWKTANTKNHYVLRYNPVSAGGQLVPPPQRTEPPQVGSAIITGIQYAADNIKATTGIYDASLGAAGNEKSGRAINARLRQASTSNYHFSDNATRALKHIGTIITEIIPVIYDRPGRVVRIVGEDMADEVITLNRDNPDPKGNLFDMSVGDYDIVVDVGPSYETKRIEMVETLIALINANPAIGQAAPDILVSNLDFAGRDDLTKRMKRFLEMTMPGLVEMEGGEDGKPTEEQIRAMVADIQKLQAELEQYKGVNAQMDQVIQKMTQELENKEMEYRSKLEQEQIKGQYQLAAKELEIEKVKIQSQTDLAKHGVDTALKLRSGAISGQGSEEETETETAEA